MCIWRRHLVVRGFLLILFSATLAIGPAPTPVLAQSSSNASVYRIFAEARFPAQARPQQQQQQQGNPDVDGGVGTGFLISGRRLLLTNNHVVAFFRDVNGQRILPIETAYEIGIIRNGTSVGIRARVVATLPEKDLALLEAAEDLPGSPFTIADYDPALHSELDSVGFPAVADIPIRAGNRNMAGVPPAQLTPIRTSGRLQRIFEVQSLIIGGSPAPLTSRVVQHTAPASPGNSGGPIINRCDQVVGVHTFDTARERGAIALQAISSVEAVRFLRAQNVQFRSASRFCFLPGTTSDYITFPAVTGVLATVLGLIALVLAARKPQIIRETVSRVHNSFSRVNRRPSSDTPRQGGWDELRGSGNDRQRDAGRDTPPPVRNASPQRGPQQGDAVVRLTPASGGPTVEILARRMSNGRAAVLGRSREYLQEQNPSDHAVVLDDKSISRRHARLTLDDRGRLTVEDLGSSSGTFKGDKKIESASFSTGDVVRFGAVSYRIVLPS